MASLDHYEGCSSSYAAGFGSYPISRSSGISWGYSVPHSVLKTSVQQDPQVPSLTELRAGLGLTTRTPLVFGTG